jgi:site-specific DNA-methyltransferase (adenine-specific)
MTLFNADCLEQLKKLEPNSIDSLVTDPPAGISFMGKEWDSDKGGRSGWVAWMTEVMRECLRVMKPGAHGLVWAIPRTSHWTATALEDAGFEVRDVITHLFGQGFPKSLDISKAIDKAAGAEREVIGFSQGRSSSVHEGGQKVGQPDPVTAPATDAAKQWSGWGTALKPASEHWILVRKPCEEKTVAANVLEWGTGGINIDASRIEAGERPHVVSNRRFGNVSYGDGLQGSRAIGTTAQGRFPANLVLSHTPHCSDDQCDIECAIKALDEQSGSAKPKPSRTGIAGGNKGPTAWSGLDRNNYYVGTWPADPGGGASRFFYCAKISASERGDGNNHPTVKPQKLMRYFCRLITPPKGTILDPFMGSGSTGMAAISEGFQFVGIELDPDYFQIAQKRIESIDLRHRAI